MIEKNKQQLLQISIDKAEEDSFVQNNSNNPPISVNNNQENIIVGLCQQNISTQQIKNRQLSFYEQSSHEHENWEPMACHFRNIQYIPKNVRTHKTLQNCFQVICTDYLPYYKSVYNIESERKKFQLFLYDRVRSIRCQLYVQCIFDLKLCIKLVRLILFLETSIGQPITLSGLEQFLKKQSKQKLIQDEDLKSYYFQALQYAIYWQKKNRLNQLLDSHFDQIQNNQRLQQCLNKKLKILNSNYHVYLLELAKNKNIYTRLILWSQIKSMRQIIISHYKKAKMNERANFLCRIMGYSKMDGWINISKAQDYQKFQKCKQQYDLQIKLWIKQQDLLSALDNLN